MTAGGGSRCVGFSRAPPPRHAEGGAGREACAPPAAPAPCNDSGEGIPVRRFSLRHAASTREGGGRSGSLATQAVRDPWAVGLVATTILLTVFFAAGAVDATVAVVIFWLVQPVLDLML